MNCNFENVFDNINFLIDCIDEKINYLLFHNDKNEKMVIIKCNNDKYYIEFTNNIDRLSEIYFNNVNKKLWSDWLVNYEPIKIVNYYDLHDVTYKNKISLFLFLMYFMGIDNVRGYHFPYLELSYSDNMIIEDAFKKFNLKYLIDYKTLDNNDTLSNNNDYQILYNNDTHNILEKYIINDFFK